jgi:hypothetical protein
MMGNCGFGMMWLGGLTWLLGLVLLVSLIVLTGRRSRGCDDPTPVLVRERRRQRP